MNVTVTHVAQPGRHPAIDKVLEMPVHSVLLVVRPYGYTPGPFVVDVILRTGVSGWLSTSQKAGRPSSRAYLNESTVQSLVELHVSEGAEFQLVEVSK